jgi:hypothetical protein
MNKPTASLIEQKTEQLFPGESLTKPYGSQATLMHMRQSEAREWLKRYRAKASIDGAQSANQWWRLIIMDIERIRGLEAATELRHLMNLERKK